MFIVETAATLESFQRSVLKQKRPASNSVLSRGLRPEVEEVKRVGAHRCFMVLLTLRMSSMSQQETTSAQQLIRK